MDMTAELQSLSGIHRLDITIILLTLFETKNTLLHVEQHTNLKEKTEGSFCFLATFKQKRKRCSTSVLMAIWRKTSDRPTHPQYFWNKQSHLSGPYSQELQHNKFVSEIRILSPG